jgi:hypothetical protein
MSHHHFLNGTILPRTNLKPTERNGMEQNDAEWNGTEWNKDSAPLFGYFMMEWN